MSKKAFKKYLKKDKTMKKQLQLFLSMLLIIGLFFSCTVTTAPGGSDDKKPVKYNFRATATAGGDISTNSTANGSYNRGTAITVAAAAEADHHFIGWYDGEKLVSQENPYSFTLNQNSAIKARFQSEIVEITDPTLEKAIRNNLGQPSGPLLYSILIDITLLSYIGPGFGDGTIKDLSGLEYLTGLTDLELPYNSISDLTPLQGLTELKRVNLSDNKIVDIKPLEGLNKLLELKIIYNQIRQIAPLKNLSSLTLLHLHDNQIEDITPLQNLTLLKDLGLSRNSISELSPLQNLKALTSLALDTNKVDSLAPLNNLTSIQKLYLSENNIKDLSPLSSMADLTILEAGKNKIPTLEPLRHIFTLKEINIYINQVSDLSPLEFLPALSYLGLHHNNITDISPLLRNPDIGTGDNIELTGNTLDNQSQLEELRAKGVNLM